MMCFRVTFVALKRRREPTQIQNLVLQDLNQKPSALGERAVIGHKSGMREEPCRCTNQSSLKTLIRSDFQSSWVKPAKKGAGTLYLINFHLNICIHFRDQCYKWMIFPWYVSVWILVSVSEHTIIELFFLYLQPFWIGTSEAL